MALLRGRRPILAILPFVIPMSARYRGTRVPSTIVPPLISVSNSAIKALLGARHDTPHEQSQGKSRIKDVGGSTRWQVRYPLR